MHLPFYNCPVIFPNEEYILVKAFMSIKKAAANPWGEGATSLEWSVSSPPPFHTFGDKVPKT